MTLARIITIPMCPQLEKNARKTKKTLLMFPEALQLSKSLKGDKRELSWSREFNYITNEHFNYTVQIVVITNELMTRGNFWTCWKHFGDHLKILLRL